MRLIFLGLSKIYAVGLRDLVIKSVPYYKKIMRYILNPREQIQDLYNIIEYREYNGLIEESIVNKADIEL